MKKVRLLRDTKIAADGRNHTEHKAGDVVELPDHLADSLLNGSPNPEAPLKRTAHAEVVKETTAATPVKAVETSKPDPNAQASGKAEDPKK